MEQTPKRETTRKVFLIGFAVCLLKLLTSGLVIGKLTLGVFSGSDFAMAVGSLGAIYTARRHSDNMTNSKDKE